MGTKGWIIFGVLIAGVLGGLIYMSQSNKLDVSGAETDVIQQASESSGNIADHARGATDSKNILVEYGDYQCPGCGTIYPHVEKLVEKQKDKIAYVYRNFPLSSMHPNALAAATAAEAAGMQDKYWDMFNYLYTNQSDWENATASDRKGIFTKYASQLKLDSDKFAADYDSDNIKMKIDFDLALGAKDGVKGTPVFYFNGKVLPDDIQKALGDGNIDEVSKWIDNNLR